MTVEESTIKILLATDNHVGYLERDPIRGRDSFDTFEEILKLAVKRNVRSNTFYVGMRAHVVFPPRLILFSSRATFFMKTDLRATAFTVS